MSTRSLHEDQIFRIDHYLGKETVQNILVFRFANGIFENVWNRNYIDHVEITAAESIGIEGRGPFYETAGARCATSSRTTSWSSSASSPWSRPSRLRPTRSAPKRSRSGSRSAPSTRPTPFAASTAPALVDGKQIAGYRQEDRVHPRSQTETYAALRLEIENWRWAGVPFYIRAGKRLAKRVTEVTIMFKQPPLSIFQDEQGKGAEGIRNNFISMRIQPDEGITLRFGAKLPGATMQISPVSMNFSYADTFGASSANGYERLLLDAMLGDATLFAHRDGVEATWALMTPILEDWAKNPIKDLPNYPAGTWGPPTSDAMLKADGRKWRKL